MKFITNELIKNFELYLYEEERSKNTIEKYLRDVRAFYRHCGNERLQKATVVEYKKLLCNTYAPKSVNSILSSLNALFVFMNWYDLKVKTLKIQKRIFADKSKELTKPEYERLLETAKTNKRIYLIMQTICSTGIRVSELKFITAESLKCGQANIDCKGKRRIVFLPKRLCKILAGYVRERNIKSGSIFITKTGKPLDRSNIWRQMKKLCDTAKVSKEKVFPHNLRHLFARTYYSMQKDIVRLADILGHSSIETTRIYTVESGEIHRKQIEKLGFLKC